MATGHPISATRLLHRSLEVTDEPGQLVLRLPFFEAV
jgi:hypothetical protein